MICDFEAVHNLPTTLDVILDVYPVLLSDTSDLPFLAKLSKLRSGCTLLLCVFLQIYQVLDLLTKIAKVTMGRYPAPTASLK